MQSNHVSQNRRVLFVGGLPGSANETSVAKYFERYGPVECTRIVRKKVTGESKGYAFVTFEEARYLDRALSHEHFMFGRRVDCYVAALKNEKQTWLQEQKKRKITVSNLPIDLEGHKLKTWFQEFGPVKNAFVIRDFKTGESKGYGYVEFYDSTALSLSLAHQVRINGILITCSPYVGQQTFHFKPPKKEPSSMSVYSPNHLQNRAVSPQAPVSNEPKSKVQAAPADYPTGQQRTSYGSHLTYEFLNHSAKQHASNDSDNYRFNLLAEPSKHRVVG